ncbi:MAG TPA: hypothetical protein VIV12_30245 [Streptosporangiaceae bacterium]
MTASSQPHVPPTAVFGDAELVFAGHPDRISGVTGPVFGRSDEWPADAIRRPSDKSPGAWKLRFPAEAAWNLRAREASFALLNPAHRALRAARVHLPARPAALQTLVQFCHHLTMVMRWAHQHGLPAHRPPGRRRTGTRSWRRPPDASGHPLSPGMCRPPPGRAGPRPDRWRPSEDPWPNRTAADVGRRATRAVSIPAIPPAAWWPLLRAAWTYIDVFAGASWTCVTASPLPHRQAAPGSQASACYDRLVAGWLADPANLVPVHATAWRDVPAGAPRWTALSLLITSGTTGSIFAAGHQRGTARRARIEAAAAEGRIQPFSNGQVPRGTDIAQNPPPRTRRAAVIDADLRIWLANPASQIPVRGREHRNGAVGTCCGRPWPGSSIQATAAGTSSAAPPGSAAAT